MTPAQPVRAPADTRAAVQSLLDTVHAAARASMTRQAWVWGQWDDSDTLSACLDLPLDGADPAPWRAWCTGPGGCLVVQEPRAALHFFRRALADAQPKGRFSAVAFEAKGGGNGPHGPSVFIGCPQLGPSWERAPRTLDPSKATTGPGYELVAAYPTAGFQVGLSAHARLHHHAAATAPHKPTPSIL